MTNHPSHSAAAKTTADRAFVPGFLGRFLGLAYAGVVRRRNRGFDEGRGVITFDRPVLSVGNLSLGGTGKTPMVERIVALLREHGRDPAIAMRGYRAERSGFSDEAELYRARFDDLPIVAQPKRVEGLIELFATPRGEGVDCVVLDDGFQHRWIARQLDLMLIDASHDPFGSAVFPAGRLREPVDGLARATHVALTHAELAGPVALQSLASRCAIEAGVTECAIASHEWSGLTVFHRGQETAEPVGFLAARRVVAACAIGRPAGFLGGLERARAHVVESFVLGDHARFSPATVERIRRAAADARNRAEAVVVTRKDWTKLAGRPIDWPCPVVVPTLEMSFRSGWERLEADILAVSATRPG